MDQLALLSFCALALDKKLSRKDLLSWEAPSQNPILEELLTTLGMGSEF